MPIGEVHHIAIKASNMEEAKAFYTEILGFPIVNSIPGSEIVFIKIGGTTIELMPGQANDSEPSSVGIAHLAFEVADVDATYAALSARGVQFHVPPRNAGDIRLAFFHGPDGVELELFKSPSITWK